ncbi:MAG: hypothetical protein R2822_18165 [Spirosomataceae bacterium]
MQSNTSSWLSWLSSLKKIGGLLKFLLLLVLLGYLYKTIESKGQSWRDIRDLLATNLNARHGLELVMVVFLTPINWACESRKWQLLAQKIEQISFYAAFKGVLAGLALGFMMPNNVGDAAGRILSLQSEQRLSGVGAALLANGLQFYVSLLFGTWGWGYFLWQQPQVRTWPQYLLFGLLLMTLLFGLWMIFNRKMPKNTWNDFDGFDGLSLM